MDGVRFPDCNSINLFFLYENPIAASCSTLFSLATRSTSFSVQIRDWLHASQTVYTTTVQLHIYCWERRRPRISPFRSQAGIAFKISLWRHWHLGRLPRHNCCCNYQVLLSIPTHFCTESGFNSQTSMLQNIRKFRYYHDIVGQHQQDILLCTYLFVSMETDLKLCVGPKTGVFLKLFLVFDPLRANCSCFNLSKLSFLSLNSFYCEYFKIKS